MKKHRGIIIGVLFITLVFAIFIGGQYLFRTSNIAEVNKNETIAPTTDGKSCNNSDQLLSDYYVPEVSYNSSGTEATISVKRGSFKATSVSAVNGNGSNVNYNSLISSDPMQLGNLTNNSSMKLSIVNGASGTVSIHFVVAVADEMCLDYDSATTNTSGKKVGTFEMDVNLELKPIKPERDTVENTNYNGICTVFRTGNGYDEYKNAFKGAGVTKGDIEKYNYSVANDNQKLVYNNFMSYCLSPNQVTFNYTAEQTASLIASAIRIAKTQGSIGTGGSDVSESFMTEFNNAKNKALALNHDYTNLVSNGSIDNTRLGMTCDWQKEKNDSDYYVNKDYYYAKEVDTENIEYTYHYTSGETEKVSGGSCTRVCEEAVVTEYGPPVASKAGLCFEYKVRVTSRVVCNSALKLTPPKTPAICTPTPLCNNIPGHVNQGGPSEEFEACIQDCDGGKYSDSCSEKCYKKVYEKNDADLLAIRYDDIPVVRLKSFPGYSGRYSWSGNSIIWQSSGGNTYGRWYQENEPTRTYNDHGDYTPDNKGLGFKRNQFVNGQCQDPCYWTGCSRKSYLNDADAAADTIRNMEKYNQAVATCSAAASCTTKTAEFTIGIDYTDTNDEEHTIDFPLTSSKVDVSKLPSHGDGFSGTTSGTEIFIPELTITPEDEDGYAGCYDDASARNWYQVAWSFPGTWINNKTGEISYVNKDGNSAWHKKEDKFCMPLNAKSVNTNWWRWKVVDKNTSVDESAIDYNIHASTTDFGYFGWNFDFSCFYALQNEEITPDCVGDECEPCVGDECDTTISPEDFVFRIVDLNDLFPKGEETTENNQSKLSSTGRQPGYNWTLDAINDGDQTTAFSLNTKNPEYGINPIELIKDIQTKGNTIYSDEYLDYRITLESSDIKELRDYNKNNKYTDYSGETSVKNGVTVYRSKVLTNLGGKVSARAGSGNRTKGGK